jgi:carotenoid cleavage dioxygenase-like enzyme
MLELRPPMSSQPQLPSQIESRNGAKSPYAPPLPIPFPPSVGLVSRSEIINLPLCILEGSLPGDLYGHAFFVGPGGSLDSHPCGDRELIHPSFDGSPLFNGDPLLHRIDFQCDENAGLVSAFLTSKIPHTPCFYTDQASLSDPEWEDYCYDNYGLARLSFMLGFRNQVNTAPTPLYFDDIEGYRMLLTWDAGRPFEIDPVSLEIATAVGHNSEWKELIDLPVPFPICTTSAHAAYTPPSQSKQGDALLFTVNFGKSLATFMHPMIHGYVDAPRTSDEQLEKDIRELISLSENLLGAVSSLLGILRKLEGFLPRPVARFGKKVTRTLLGVGRRLFLPHLPDDNALNKTSFLHAIVELIHDLLAAEEHSNARTAASPLDASISELLRLTNVAKNLLKSSSTMHDFVHLISWDGQKPLKKWKIVVEDGSTHSAKSPQIMQSMHQICVTEDYVVLMDTVFKLGMEQLLTAPAPDHPDVERLIRKLLDFRQSDITVVYIVARSELLVDKDHVFAKRLEIPRGTAHFLVDYANPLQRITLYCVHNTGWDAAEWVRSYDRDGANPYPLLVGMATGSTDVNVIARYVINAEDASLEESQFATDNKLDMNWMVALYSFCLPDGVTPPEKIESLFLNSWGSHGDLLPEYVRSLNQEAQPRQYTVQQAVSIASQGLPGTLLHLNTSTMTISDRYLFPAGCFGNSAQFIPRPGSSPGGDSGYLMCIVNSSDHPEQSEFWLFDAQNLSSGPICRLGHPSVKLGLTIHSTWIPEVQRRCATYQVSVREDYDERLNHIKRPVLSPLFQKYVYPHFDI